MRSRNANEPGFHDPRQELSREIVIAPSVIHREDQWSWISGLAFIGPRFARTR
jgi:hypothetical protein